MCKETTEKHLDNHKGNYSTHNHGCSHGHNHIHGHSHHHSSSVKNIKTAFLLNLFFSILEIVGGLLTNSSAILSDAIHDFGDSLSLGLSLIFEKHSTKPANNKYPYGYKRLSVISAIINIVVLSIGTIIVVKESIVRLLSPQPIVAKGMLLLAIFGIAVNGLSVLKMKDSIKISEKAVMLHLLEDLFGWIAVLIVSIVVIFTDLYILDPILSLLICCIMFKNIYHSTKSLYSLIMQATPENITLSSVESEILNSINNITINSMKVWSLDGESNVATLVIKTDNTNTLEETFLTKSKIKDILTKYNITDSTIEIETN